MSAAKDNPEQEFHEFEADPMAQLPGWVRCLLKLPGGGLCLLCGFMIITIPLVLVVFLIYLLFACTVTCAACICPCFFPETEEEKFVIETIFIIAFAYFIITTERKEKHRKLPIKQTLNST